jgi:hypothetical protein
MKFLLELPPFIVTASKKKREMIIDRKSAYFSYFPSFFMDGSIFHAAG